MLEKGQELECKVLSVDQERRRIALGLKQNEQDPWIELIPSKYLLPIRRSCRIGS